MYLFLILYNFGPIEVREEIDQAKLLFHQLMMMIIFRSVDLAEKGSKGNSSIFGTFKVFS